MELDLVHYNLYRDLRTVDPNLLSTTRPPATTATRRRCGRTRRTGQIVYFVSTGQQDYTALSTALNRRLKAHFQGGITYTLDASAMHDDGTASLTNPTANNQFNYLDGEYATSTAFQRNTLRVWALYQLPWGFSTSALLLATDRATRYNATIATALYGKPGTNRLNLTANGGAIADDHDSGGGARSVARRTDDRRRAT